MNMNFYAANEKQIKSNTIQNIINAAIKKLSNEFLKKSVSRVRN
jgi:hypothetical protein